MFTAIFSAIIVTLALCSAIGPVLIGLHREVVDTRKRGLESSLAEKNELLGTYEHDIDAFREYLGDEADLVSLSH